VQHICQFRGDSTNEYRGTDFNPSRSSRRGSYLGTLPPLALPGKYQMQQWGFIVPNQVAPRPGRHCGGIGSLQVPLEAYKAF
jgi:hypothetical protein